MSSRHEHSDQEFAQRLASLTPAAVLTRDRVLFEAGRNAGRKEARPWRYTASVMAACLIGLLAFETWNGSNPPMASRSPPQPTEQQPPMQMAQAAVESPPFPVSRSAEAAPSSDYLRVRDLVLQRGVEAMPLTVVLRTNPKRDVRRQPTDEKEGDGAWWRLRARQMGGASL
jgi:hypothetical protein